MIDLKCPTHQISAPYAYIKFKCRCVICVAAHKQRANEYYLKNKDDVKEKRRIYRNKNRLKENLKSRNYYNQNKEQVKEYLLSKKYSMTLAEYNRLVVSQNNRCAICCLEKKLVVDHSHETKRVRGLLCHTCNLSLGLFQDNPAILQSAVNYINKAPKK